MAPLRINDDDDDALRGIAYIVCQCHRHGQVTALDRDTDLEIGAVNSRFVPG